MNTEWQFEDIVLHNLYTFKEMIFSVHNNRTKMISRYQDFVRVHGNHEENENWASTISLQLFSQCKA